MQLMIRRCFAMLADDLVYIMPYTLPSAILLQNT
jgi:hypothetical protein